MSRSRRRRGESPAGRLLVGLMITAVGVIFLLDRMGVVDARDFLEWWPVAFLVFGVSSALSGSWLGAAIWLTAGTILLLPRLGLPEIEIWGALGLWPLMISFAGVVLVRQALRPPPKNVFGESASVFRAGAFMSGNSHSIGSLDFLGGEAVACMGGCKIDLRRAEMRGDEAVVDVLAFWGGIDIKIPPEWTVERHVTPVLGGFEDRTCGDDGKKRLIIRGSAIMGGVEVSN